MDTTTYYSDYSQAYIQAAQNPVVSGLSLVLLILLIVAMWKIFEKAGEAGWKSIIPFYNMYILYKIVWGQGWLFLLLLIPCVGFIVNIIMLWKMSKAFGRGAGTFLGLLLIPNIFYLILGFGSAEYVGPQN